MIGRIRKAALVGVMLAFVAGTANAAEVSVEDAEVQTEGEAVVDVVLDSAPDGVQRYNVTVSLEDGDVGRIKTVREGDVEGFQTRYRTPDVASFRAADLQQEVQRGSTDVVLGSLVVEGVGSGSSDVEVEVNELRGDDGEPIEPVVTPGSLSVDGGIPSQGSTASVVLGGLAALLFVVLWGRSW